MTELDTTSSYDDIQAADKDTEILLQELSRISAMRRKDPALEKRYEWLRNRLAAILETDGPRMFVDERGRKQLAQAIAPEAMVVDVARMQELFDEGAITYDTFDKACPRKPNLEAFEMLVAQGLISSNQLRYVARPVPRTKYIKTSAVEDEA